MDKKDGRKQNGGKRKGAGRPTKANEEELLARLRPMDEIALAALKKGIKNGDYNYWNKFMEYRYGKTKDRLDITTGDESFNQPILNFFKTKKDKE